MNVKELIRAMITYVMDTKVKHKNKTKSEKFLRKDNKNGTWP